MWKPWIVFLVTCLSKTSTNTMSKVTCCLFFPGDFSCSGLVGFLYLCHLSLLKRGNQDFPVYITALFVMYQYQQLFVCLPQHVSMAFAIICMLSWWTVLCHEGNIPLCTICYQTYSINTTVHFILVRLSMLDRYLISAVVISTVFTNNLYFKHPVVIMCIR
jgi:hypothetical protein